MPRQLKPCGTVAAYRRHIKAREETCPACREAARILQQKYAPLKPRVLQPCGTPAAYKRHVNHGEPACRACLDAIAAIAAERYAARKAAA